MPNAAGEQTVYLVPEYVDGEGANQVLSQVYPMIFEVQLYGWDMDEAAWPRDRTLEMFREWFAAEMHSVVNDLCGFPLEDDIRESTAYGNEH